MTCREFAEFLAAWLDGELPASEAEVFERHLRVCGHCTNYLSSYRTTLALSSALAARDTSPVPDSVPEELVRAVLDARRSALA